VISQCGHAFPSNMVIRFLWFKCQFRDLVCMW